MPDHTLSRRNVLRSAGVAVGVVAGLPAAEAQVQTASKTTQLPTGAVTVVAYVQATGGCEDKLAEISTRLMGEVRANEPGNLLFQTHRGSDVPGIILFYEIFETEEAFQAHKDAEHTKRWFRQIESLVASPVEVFVLSATK